MATDTRDLIVKIKGDTKGFESAMKGVTKQSGEAGLSFGKMAGAVAAGQAIFAAAKVGIEKTTQFLAGSVKQYQEAETASKELAHSVLDVSHATKQQLASTNALADSLSKKGVLDDDVIRKGLAQLSTFGLTNKSVQKLAGSMADLTVNQFGVKASGEQAVTAANIMAKALNGNYGALEKMGIHLTDTQKKLIKFGNEAKKVDTINQVLAANLRTNQATALQTSEGRLAHLSVMYGNIRESIGKLITDAMTPLLGKISDFVTRIDWDKAIAKAKLSLQGLWKEISNLYNQIYKVVDAIEKYLQPKFVALVNTIKDMMPTYIRWWKEILLPLSKVLGEVIVFAIGLAIDALNLLLTTLKPVIDFFLNNKPVLIAFATALGIVAAALNFGNAVAAFQASMAAVRLSFATTQAAIAAPMVMPAIVIAAALASLVVVYEAVMSVRKAIRDTSDAAKAAANSTEQQDTVATIKGLKNTIANGTAAQKARAQKQLNNLYEGKGYLSMASGGFTGTGGKNEVAGIVHKGEYVIPQEGVNQATGQPKGGGINITVNMGMYAGMPVEKRQIALDMYRELVRAARSNGVNLPVIPQARVQ